MKSSRNTQIRVFDDEIYEQQDIPSFKQGAQSSKRFDLPKDFSKLQNKLQENKRKRNQNTNIGVGRDIAVPQSRDTLLLKYGPVPNKSTSVSRRADQEIPSYKKDAMRLIINRIYRQIGNVFEELQKKVMRDDVMKLRRVKHNQNNNIEDIKESLKRLRINKENDVNSSNHSTERGDDQQLPLSQFRQRFEIQKQRIKESLQIGSMDTSHQQDSLFQSKILVLEDDQSKEEEFDQMPNQMTINEYRHQQMSSQQQQQQQQIDDESRNQYDDNYFDSQVESQKKEEVCMSPFNRPNRDLKQIVNQRYLSDESEQEQDDEMADIVSTADVPSQQQEQIYQIQAIEEHNHYEDIIKPSKKVTSYIQKDFQDKLNAKQQLNQITKQTNRQQEAVEMSFSENPFGGRRISSQMNTHSSNGNQHSPDFNKGKELIQQSNKVFSFISPAFQNNLNSNHNNNTITEQETEQSIIQHFTANPKDEDNLQVLERRPKFAQSLKQLMSELEVKKKANDQLDNQQEESKDSQSSRFSNLLNKFQKDKVQNPSQPEQQQQLSKVQTLRINKGHQEKQNSCMVIQSSKQQDEPVETDLGQMHRLSSNTVMFIEKRDLNKQQLQQQNVIKIQGKKKQQQQQMMAHSEQQEQELIKLEQSMKEQKRMQSIELLLQNIAAKILDQQKVALMELLRFSIDKSKAQLIVRLLENTKVQQRKFQKAWWQWKMFNQEKINEIVIKKKEQQSQSLTQTSIIIKHKHQTQMKQAFDGIINYSYSIVKFAKEQKQRRSIQQIVNYVKKKDLQKLNKKFQKYRKSVFLLNFDLKLASLANLFDGKVLLYKKEGFKEIINFCLRNEQFKKQYEQLSNDYENQQQRLVAQQLSRAVKIGKCFIFKVGFQSIKKHSSQQIIQSKVVQRMIKNISKYNDFKEKHQMNKYLQSWKKGIESIKKKEQLQMMGCKKIKLLLTVSSSRNLKARMEQWKSETVNFINIEMTKHNQEKEQQRHTNLEQVMVDLWWAALNKGFSAIKDRAKLKKQLTSVVKKKESKFLKLSKVEMLRRWKQEVYRHKLLKVNLQVLIKNIDNRVNKKLNLSVQKWKQFKITKRNQESKVGKLLHNKMKRIEAISESHLNQKFQLWKTKLQSWNYFKQLFLQYITVKESKECKAWFNKWKMVSQEELEKQQKTMVLQNACSKVMLKFKFKKLKQNAEIVNSKRNSSQLIFQLLKVKHDSFMRSTFNQINAVSKLKIQQVQQQKESVKQIKRLKKIIDQKDLQRYLIRWKMNGIDKASKQEKQKMIKQYQKRTLIALMTKTKLKQLNQGFQSLKGNCSGKQKSHLQNSLKMRSACFLLDKINNIYLKRMKSYMKMIEDYSNQVQQDNKVTMAISKLSAVTKICEIMDKIRIDRHFFYKWQTLAAASSSNALGLEVIENLFHSYKKKYFVNLKKASHQIMIERTKLKIGKNMLKVLLYKQYKDQTQRSFSLWSMFVSRSKKKRNISLPPRSASLIAESQNYVKIFNNNSKVNSANNSYIQNQRYSSKGDDDNDYMQDEEINGQSPIFIIQTQHDRNNKSLDIFIADQSSPCNQMNKRSSTTKNQCISQASMWSFLEHEKDCSERNSTTSDKSHSLAQVSIKQGQDDQQIATSSKLCNKNNSQPVTMTKKASGSRNKTQSLNKYLSNNSSQNKMTSSVVSIDLNIGAAQMQQLNNIVVENQESRNQSNGNNNLMKQSANNSALSPMNQELEPVPEEPLRKKKIGSRKRKETVSNKLSSFLSIPPVSSKKPLSKEEQKHNKKKSLENHEKFKMFLKKPKSLGNYEGSEDQQYSNHELTNLHIPRIKNFQPGFDKLSQILRRFTLKDTLEDIITEVFDEEWEPIYQERLRVRQQIKIQKVMKIRQRIMKDGKLVKWEAFSLWKRSDYLTMLSSLQKFKHSLTQIYHPGNSNDDGQRPKIIHK